MTPPATLVAPLISCPRTTAARRCITHGSGKGLFPSCADVPPLLTERFRHRREQPGRRAPARRFTPARAAAVTGHWRHAGLSSNNEMQDNSVQTSAETNVTPCCWPASRPPAEREACLIAAGPLTARHVIPTRSQVCPTTPHHNIVGVGVAPATDYRCPMCAG